MSTSSSWSQRMQALLPNEEEQQQFLARVAQVPKETLHRSKFVGVSRKKYRGSWHWQASIWLSGKVKHLGYFPDEKDAAIRYDDEARKYDKPVNFPDSSANAPEVQATKSSTGPKEYTSVPTPQYVGTYFHKSKRKWQIRLPGEKEYTSTGQLKTIHKHAGYATTEEEAAKIYDAAVVRKAYDPPLPLNFPEDYNTADSEIIYQQAARRKKKKDCAGAIDQRGIEDDCASSSSSTFSSASSSSFSLPPRGRSSGGTPELEAVTYRIPPLPVGGLDGNNYLETRLPMARQLGIPQSQLVDSAAHQSQIEGSTVTHRSRNHERSSVVPI